MFVRIKLSIYLLAAFQIGAFLIIQSANARGFGGDRGGFDRGNLGGGDRNFSNDFGRTDRSYYGDDAAAAARRPGTQDGGMARDEATWGAPGRGVAGARDLAHPAADAARFGPERGDAVRHAYRDRDLFDARWWDTHHNGWYYPWMNGYGYGYAAWPMMAGFWGMAAANTPVDYDYGNNITYQGNTVYYGSTPTYSAPAYAEQATTLAYSAPVAMSAPAAVSTDAENATVLPKIKPEEQKDWKQLGVYSLVQGGQTDTSKIFQLMTNKDGHIHGNYYDTMTDEVKPVSGAIDKKSMRAAWTVSGAKNVVYDTGVSNLLKPESAILIHFGKDKTQQWNLVRLEDPNKKDDLNKKEEAADKADIGTTEGLGSKTALDNNADAAKADQAQNKTEPLNKI